MIGSYVLSFQVSWRRRLHAREPEPAHESILITAMFVVSARLAVAAQLRITGWPACWGSDRALVIGMLVVALAFVLRPGTRREVRVAAGIGVL